MNKGELKGLSEFISYYFFIGLLVLIMVLIVKAAPTAVTLDTPAQDEVISGTAYSFGATVTGTSTTNVTFWYSSDSGATWISFTSVANTSADQTAFSTNYNTINIPDADNYIFNASADDILNLGTAFVSDTSTGVDVDNTAPIFSVLNITDGTTTLNNDSDLQGKNFTKDADITIRVTVTETRPDTIYLYVNLTDGGVSTTTYDNLTNMTTTDTSSPFMYNATILASDISDQSNVSFLIVGNDTEGNEYILNYTASGQGFNFVVDATTPIIWETLDNFEPVDYGNFSTLSGGNALAVNISVNETNTGSELFVYACLSNSTGCVGGEVALNNESCDSNIAQGTCYWSNSSFNTRNVADGIYNVTFNATDLVENSNATDASFTKGLNILVDNTLPVFSYINISDGNTTRTNGTSLNNTFKIDNTQDITVRTTIADGNIDSLYLYYVCNSTNATTSNYYDVAKMSTEDTIAARGSSATFYMYNGTISQACLEDGNETTFIIIGNDTAANEFQINDTSISAETLFTITLNSTLVKVSDVNVTDGTYTRTTFDGTKYMTANLHTFNIELQGEDKEKDGVLLYYNTTGSMSTAVDGIVSNYDNLLVTNNLSDATSSGNSKVVFNTTVDLTGNNTNTIEFYIVANDTSGYVILRGPYTYKIDGASPNIPTLTAPSTTVIGPGDSIEYSCESSDAGIGIASWVWTLVKPNRDTVEKTDTGVTKSTKSFSGTTEVGSGGSYTIKCKATDNLGYVSSETSSTFIVSATAGTLAGAAGGGGGAAVVTFDIDFTTANEGTLKAQQGRVKSFSFDGVTKHTLTFMTVTDTSTTLKIESTPVIVTLNIGETKDVDVNVDTINDISVKLNDIVNGVADITIKKVEEGAAKIVEEEEVARGVEKEKITTPIEGFKEAKGKVWLWIILLIIILGVGYYVYKKKRWKRILIFFK